MNNFHFFKFIFQRLLVLNRSAQFHQIAWTHLRKITKIPNEIYSTTMDKLVAVQDSQHILLKPFSLQYLRSGGREQYGDWSFLHGRCLRHEGSTYLADPWHTLFSSGGEGPQVKNNSPSGGWQWDKRTEVPLSQEEEHWMQKVNDKRC